MALAAGSAFLYGSKSDRCFLALSEGPPGLALANGLGAEGLTRSQASAI